MIINGPVSVPDMADRSIHVARVEEGDGIHHEPERPELVLLPGPIGLVQIPAAAVEHGASQIVAGLGPVQLHQDSPATGLVGHVGEHGDRLDDASQLGDGTAQCRRLA